MARTDPPPIEITLAGDPNPSSLTVKDGQTLQWQADPQPNGKFPEWRVCFSPFRDHVLKTDPNTGLTRPMTTAGFIGECYYKVLAFDPIGAKKRRKRKLGGGGGIIIDN